MHVFYDTNRINAEPTFWLSFGDQGEMRGFLPKAAQVVADMPLRAAGGAGEFLAQL